MSRGPQESDSKRLKWVAAAVESAMLRSFETEGHGVMICKECGSSAPQPSDHDPDCIVGDIHEAYVAIYGPAVDGVPECHFHEGRPVKGWNEYRDVPMCADCLNRYAESRSPLLGEPGDVWGFNAEKGGP